jgi:hypothetical protein
MIDIIRPLHRQWVYPVQRRKHSSPEIHSSVTLRRFAIPVTTEDVRKHSPDDHNNQPDDQGATPIHFAILQPRKGFANP